MTVLLVTGSRTWTDYELMLQKIRETHPTRIIHGGADGADRLATDVADELKVSVIIIRAKWREHIGCRCRDKTPGSLCRYAGPRRNRQMLDLRPDRVLAFWDGRSTGTKDCVDEARRRGVPVEVVTPGPSLF